MYTESDLNALDVFFKAHKPLPNNVKTNPGITIIDSEKFVASHLSVLRNNNNRTFLPFYFRLLQFKEILEAGKA